MYECNCDLTEEEYPVRLMVSAHIEVYLDRKGNVTSVSVSGSNQGDPYPYPYALECSECGEEFDEENHTVTCGEEMAKALTKALEEFLGVTP